MQPQPSCMRGESKELVKALPLTISKSIPSSAAPYSNGKTAFAVPFRLPIRTHECSGL
jgi:hypothetical protein